MQTCAAQQPLGEVILKLRLRAVAAAAVAAVLAGAGAQAQPQAATPDFNGVWKPLKTVKLLKTEDGQAPPLTASARKAYAANLAARRKGDLSFDSSSLCLSPGIPRLLQESAFRIVQRPDLLVFAFQWNHRVRQVYIGQQHGSQLDASYLGDAIASWSGDELVVETVGISDATLIDDATPHSDKLKVTERYRLVDGGKTLEDRVTLEDPETFAKPWTYVVHFARQPATAELTEDVCTDRLNLIPTMEGAKPAPKPRPAGGKPKAKR